MSQDAYVLTWFAYRAFVVLIGFACIFLGYKLLVKGIFDGGADIDGAWDNNKKLIIRRASPGALLFLVGFGVIVLSTLFSKFSMGSSGVSPQNNISANQLTNSSAVALTKDKKVDCNPQLIKKAVNDPNPFVIINGISGRPSVDSGLQINGFPFIPVGNDINIQGDSPTKNEKLIIDDK